MTQFVWSQEPAKMTYDYRNQNVIIEGQREKWIGKEHEIMFWVNRNVLYLVWYGGHMYIKSCQKSSNWTLKMCSSLHVNHSTIKK